MKCEMPSNPDLREMMQWMIRVIANSLGIPRSLLVGDGEVEAGEDSPRISQIFTD